MTHAIWQAPRRFYLTRVFIWNGFSFKLIRLKSQTTRVRRFFRAQAAIGVHRSLWNVARYFQVLARYQTADCSHSSSVQKWNEESISGRNHSWQRVLVSSHGNSVKLLDFKHSRGFCEWGGFLFCGLKLCGAIYCNPANLRLPISPDTDSIERKENGISLLSAFRRGACDMKIIYPPEESEWLPMSNGVFIGVIVMARHKNGSLTLG